MTAPVIAAIPIRLRGPARRNGPEALPPASAGILLAGSGYCRGTRGKRLSQPYQAAAWRDRVGPAERGDERVAGLAGAGEPGDVVAGCRRPGPRAVPARCGAAGPAPVCPRRPGGRQSRGLSGAPDDPDGRRRGDLVPACERVAGGSADGLVA